MKRAILYILYLFPSLAFALGPSQIALIVNNRSAVSKEVANHYITLRKIPLRNVVYLDEIPESCLQSPYRITRSDYRTYIYEPTKKELIKRGLSQIKAWVFSADFPVKVKTGSTADISLHGITLTRGRIPPEKDVKQGTYVSALFAGPDPETGTVNPPTSFGVSIPHDNETEPLPSMSLGFTGERGNSVPEILRCLKRGVLSDTSAPKGTIFFMENDNVRTKCRKWQFPRTQVLLQQLGIHSLIRTNHLHKERNIIGIMDGIAKFTTQDIGTFVPGAMAENLTSGGAFFEADNQTKCTRWIAAGATASSGAVTEPYAIWMKFPSAPFFIYYVQGCSMIESFYQSVRCPLQLYIIGEPLATPWKRRFSITAIALDVGPFSGSLKIYTQLTPRPSATSNIRYTPYIDGKLFFSPPNKNEIQIDTTKLTDGWHNIRVVASFGSQIVWQTFDDYGFSVNNHGRSIRLTGIKHREKIKINEKKEVSIQATDTPIRTGLAYGLKEIEWQHTSGGSGFFNPKEIAAGPCTLQAFAEYEDGEKIYSKPVLFRIE